MTEVSVMISRIVGYILKKIVGELKWAQRHGLNCGRGCTSNGGAIFGSEPYLITLHDYVRLSFNVTFITHDGGNYAFRHLDEYKNVNHFGKIEIGEYSFLGANCIIMPGVVIGANCVVGAGAVVTRSVPDGCVVAGVPARIICSTQEYAQKMKQRMPDDWDVKEYSRNKQEYLKRVLK